MDVGKGWNWRGYGKLLGNLSGTSVIFQRLRASGCTGMKSYQREQHVCDSQRMAWSIYCWNHSEKEEGNYGSTTTWGDFGVVNVEDVVERELGYVGGEWMS
jgi:hypothetical protein